MYTHICIYTYNSMICWKVTCFKNQKYYLCRKIIQVYEKWGIIILQRHFTSQLYPHYKSSYRFKATIKSAELEKSKSICSFTAPKARNHWYWLRKSRYGGDIPKMTLWTQQPDTPNNEIMEPLEILRRKTENSIFYLNEILQLSYIKYIQFL